MQTTLVIQSHRMPLPHAWLTPCLASVKAWAASRAFDYRFLDDELFTPVAADLLEKTAAQPVVATDIARLYWLQKMLDHGYETVIWADADVLLFAPDRLLLPDTPCAFGRENWVQQDANGKLRNHRKIHNAFMMFRRGNTLLPFYIETAERLLRQNSGSMPPQFIGPKWLSALHNFSAQPVIESVDMLSPPVLKDWLAGGGDALRMHQRKTTSRLAGFNLCASSCERGAVSNDEMVRLVDGLLTGRLIREL